MEVAGGAGFFRVLGLERLFRDVQAARYHPVRERRPAPLHGPPGARAGRERLASIDNTEKENAMLSHWTACMARTPDRRAPGRALRAAQADVVTDANAKAAEIASRHPATPISVRMMAIVQVSVFEAVNAITGRYPRPCA